MAKKLTTTTNPVFEQIKRTDENGNEFWSTQDLAKVLEYSEYRHFLPVIEKAKEACKNSAYKVFDHFEELLDMIEIGKGGQRQINDVRLTRSHVTSLCKMPVRTRK